ncbi:hypothetical protein Efla_001793 [Eimeria flavescens]
MGRTTNIRRKHQPHQLSEKRLPEGLPQPAAAAAAAAAAEPRKRQSKRLAALEAEWQQVAQQAATILSNARPMSPRTRQAIYESEVTRFDVLRYVFSSEVVPAPPLPLLILNEATNPPPPSPPLSAAADQEAAAVERQARPKTAAEAAAALHQESSSSEDHWDSEDEREYGW